MRFTNVIAALRTLVLAVVAALLGRPAHAGVTSFYVDPGNGSYSNTP
jgi:hypothetical protein